MTFFASLKSLKKGVGSGIGSGVGSGVGFGSSSHRYGSADPHQNVTDPNTAGERSPVGPSGTERLSPGPYPAPSTQNPLRSEYNKTMTIFKCF